LEGTIENAASTTYAESGFTANDLYDPQGGSGAAQCVGFDQLALLYTRYRVLKSHINVVASINSTSATPTATAIFAQLCVYPSTVSTGATTAGDGFSQPHVVMKDFQLGSATTVDMSIDIAKFIGNAVTADRLQALVTTSPSQVVYWHIGVVSRAYTGIVTDLQVKITYDCEFFNRALLDRSVQLLIRKAYVQRCCLLLAEAEQESKKRKDPLARLKELLPVEDPTVPESKASVPKTPISICDGGG